MKRTHAFVTTVALVLAACEESQQPRRPGIDFDPVPGLADGSRMPHAWQAGPQTTLLARQLAEMPPNGFVVLTIPKAPF